MPVYEYKCPACHTDYDVLQSMRDRTPVECPECGVECQRVYNAAPVHFQGGGWSGNGYKRGDASAVDE